MKSISVKASTNYEVLVGENLLNSLGSLIKTKVNSKRIAVITDDIVEGLYLEKVIFQLESVGYTVFSYSFPNGEQSKNIGTVIKVIEFLAQHNMTRDDTVIALGGGVVGDITGFCSSIYMRGINYIQVPTTLLAGIDSSIGGKTAVNLSFGKNLVGTFCQPLLVIFDILTLKTLSEAEIYNGIGEGIKYAILEGGRLLEILQYGLDFKTIEEFSYLCINSKKRIVEADEREGGMRKLLNLGHTFAHAIENASNYTLNHGHCVGIGIGLISDVCLKHKILSKKDYNIIKSLLEKYKFDTNLITDKETLLKIISLDKKVIGNKITMVVINKIGDCSLLDVALSNLKEFIE